MFSDKDIFLWDHRYWKEGKCREIFIFQMDIRTKYGYTRCFANCERVRVWRRRWKSESSKRKMPGLPAGLSGLFHLCEGSCLCATSPNGKTNRVLYCYGEVLFNCLILLSTISSAMERSCLIVSSYYLLSLLLLWRAVFHSFILSFTIISIALEMSPGIIFICPSIHYYPYCYWDICSSSYLISSFNA